MEEVEERKGGRGEDEDKGVKWRRRETLDRNRKKTGRKEGRKGGRKEEQ